MKYKIITVQAGNIECFHEVQSMLNDGWRVQHVAANDMRFVFVLYSTNEKHING